MTMPGFDQRLEVHADGDVQWGPDPDDVAGLAAAAQITGEQARAALAWMHEREAQQ